jgi:hypothetical protein
MYNSNGKILQFSNFLPNNSCALYYLFIVYGMNSALCLGSISQESGMLLGEQEYTAPLSVGASIVDRELSIPSIFLSEQDVALSL